MCIQCGTCGGSCPSAADMDHTPRQLFAMTRAGFASAVVGLLAILTVRDIAAGRICVPGR